MKKCVVSFATNHLNYPAGIERIRRSLDKLGFDGEFLSWVVDDEYPEGCPSHDSSPYGFKPWVMSAARDAGFELCLFVDTSIVLYDLKSIFDSVSKDGAYFFQELRQIEVRRVAGEKISDLALARMGVDRDYALTVPQLSAGVVGLDFRNDAACRFLDDWLALALDGDSFKGYGGPVSAENNKRVFQNIDGFSSPHPRVVGHQHDQSIASILAHKNGFRPHPRDNRVFKVERYLVKPVPLVQRTKERVSRLVGRLRQS